MSTIDWIVLLITLGAVVAYGVYKGKAEHSIEGYFLSGRDMPWWIVLLSIMGTQASAVTFLSAPGQAYTDGMRFVQYYFGLPIAAIVICVSFIPVFSKLKIVTAYEYLEQRFDAKTRMFASALFLLQRALSTGISIFAPSLILSTLLGWNIYATCIIMGGILIIYTLTGGARAVAHTQKLQLLIVLGAMLGAAFLVVRYLPQNISFIDTLAIAGKMGKMNIITSGTEKGFFNWGDKYNIVSGIVGGFFLALSYFGTDQSQVGRYLAARSEKESKLGMLVNGIVKVPMQFGILLVGVLVFTFYMFNATPLFFNKSAVKNVQQSAYAQQYNDLSKQYDVVNQQKEVWLRQYGDSKNEAILYKVKELQQRGDSLRTTAKKWIKQSGQDDNDANYIFLRFVLDYMPIGFIGLFIAVIFLASWGSIAAALNSLASSTIVDFYKRYGKPQSDTLYYTISKFYTLAWGVFCIIVALFMYNIGNSLIEAVNILGSLFYGTILGIFLVAFYLKSVKGTAVFYAALVTECLVIFLFVLTRLGIVEIGFLWLNMIGALLVMLLSLFFQKITPGLLGRALK